MTVDGKAEAEEVRQRRPLGAKRSDTTSRVDTERYLHQKPSARVCVTLGAVGVSGPRDLLL